MRRRILVVDDNRDLADDLAELLEDEGYAVSTAYSGEEALALAGDGQFDTILTDVRMPGISGVELVQRLGALQPRVTFLLMTAYSSEAALGEATQAGVRTILHKPIDLARLFDRLPRSQVHVLVIDDDAEFSARLADGLRSRGYQSDAAGSVAEARRLCAADPPDAAVIDAVLGDGDAIDLARGLCAERIPVVLIGGPQGGAEALPAPWAQFVGEPFAVDAVVDALRTLVTSDVESG